MSEQATKPRAKVGKNLSITVKNALVSVSLKFSPETTDIPIVFPPERSDSPKPILYGVKDLKGFVRGGPHTTIDLQTLRDKHPYIFQQIAESAINGVKNPREARVYRFKTEEGRVKVCGDRIFFGLYAA